MERKKRNWIYGGLIGLVLGIVIFLWLTWSQFIANIGDFGVWRMFILVILEPTLAGALLPIIYDKIMKLQINKTLLWILYIVIIGVILGITIMWFTALNIGVGIVGL